MHGGNAWSICFLFNKLDIVLTEEVGGVNGVMGSCQIYPESVAPMSFVGLNKKHTFLTDDVLSAMSELPYCF